MLRMPRGRAGVDPRVARTRATVLQAAAELLAERGYSGFSVDALVERTGVSKTTMYRHWPSRIELLASTIAGLVDRLDVPDTGTLRGDLLAFIQERTFVSGGDNLDRSLPGLIEAAERDPALLAVVSKVVLETYAQLNPLVERARTRGELRTDFDNSLLISVIVGPFFFRRLLTHEPTTKPQAEAIVDMLLQGLTAPEHPSGAGKISGPEARNRRRVRSG
jgi:AcrR family transcriptional regulator